MNSRLKKLIGLIVAGVILFFIIRNLVTGLGELEAYEFRLSYWRIVKFHYIIFL